MSVDAQLLRAQTSPNQDDQNGDESSSEDRAGDLRSAQRDASAQEQATAFDLRTQVMMSRKEQLEKEKKKGEGNKLAVSAATSLRLREMIVSIPESLGANFFYVIYHWFQSKVGNKKKYVKLGTEWFDVPGMTEKVRDDVGSNFNAPEGCCFFVALGGCAFAILLSLLPILLIADIIANPSHILQFPSAAWGFLKAIVNSYL